MKVSLPMVYYIAGAKPVLRTIIIETGCPAGRTDSKLSQYSSNDDLTGKYGKWVNVGLSKG